MTLKVITTFLSCCIASLLLLYAIISGTLFFSFITGDLTLKIKYKNKNKHKKITKLEKFYYMILISVFWLPILIFNKEE